MLIQVTASTIRQRCSGCGTERELPIASLTLGKDNAPSVIELPTCTAVPCTSQEWLLRNLDAIHPALAGSLNDHHRRGVNALAQVLKTMGNVEAGLADAFAAEAAEPPPDIASIPWSLPE